MSRKKTPEQIEPANVANREMAETTERYERGRAKLGLKFGDAIPTDHAKFPQVEALREHRDQAVAAVMARHLAPTVAVAPVDRLRELLDTTELIADMLECQIKRDAGAVPDWKSLSNELHDLKRHVAERLGIAAGIPLQSEIRSAADLKNDVDILRNWIGTVTVLPPPNLEVGSVVEYEWSTPHSPSHWAEIFNVSESTIKRRFKTKTIKNKRHSSQKYLVAMVEIPIEHKARFKAPTKTDQK